MGFLIRCAFWLSLVLLFIPFKAGGEGLETHEVGPLQAVMAARDAVRDVAGLCERQPAACATARAAMRTITARVGEGMRIAQGLIEEEAEPAEEPQVSAAASVAPAE